jgi:predicted PhzF superfamily epimerase YddE/YHI9
VLHVLRVFCAADGTGGNELGVFLDGGEVGEPERQGVALRLGFAETVFVDDAPRGVVRIFTPEVELGFAGHPLVGTAWLLGREGVEVDVLRPPHGEVPVRFDGEFTAIVAEPGWGPSFDFQELGSAAEVDAFAGAGPRNLSAWAWLDEPEGVLRSRVFVPEAGVPEDEATGSAALRLAAALGRSIEIRQGRGSVLFARPLAEGLAEVGGRVAFEELRAPPPAGAW